jgi:transposase
MEKLGSHMHKIKNASMDMSSTCALVFNDLASRAVQVTDKFHVMKFFRHGLTNAKAERLNGKIQRFASNNYGLKDKDFFLYRTVNYFS